MKARREHRVALSERALATVKELSAARSSEYIFPGQKPGKPLSNMAMLMLLERMGKRRAITSHGFRSTFSDWASEVSPYSAELRETALAHTIANKAEAAYRRGDALEKRRAMMEAWAQWCEPKAAMSSHSLEKAKPMRDIYHPGEIDRFRKARLLTVRSPN
jgi:integrase